MFENELILPGTITEIESDYSYDYNSANFGTTDPVVIIGTAFNGPVNQVTKIQTPEHAHYVFGESFDSSTRQEATLVSGIIDAWDRGARTIYAVRVSGKEIYKDFSLVPETTAKLRVSGMYPSNANKDIYMVYDNCLGDEKIKIYKPASRACIAEKMEGAVDSLDGILCDEISLSNQGLTIDSPLTELVSVVNNHRYNNVIVLSIVDEDGNDITKSSIEVKELKIGALFPGLYLIGRDKNVNAPVTNIDFKFINDDNAKPYESYSDILYKQLVINTDVNAPYPIYGPTVRSLNEKLIGLNMVTMWDCLDKVGAIDLAYEKDKIDYEEVTMSNFELYNKLGSGYAITAKAELREDGTIKKIKETTVEDPKRVIELKDGVYSMLQNVPAKYRVLTCAYADSKITGRLPKKDAFKKSIPNYISVNDTLNYEFIVDSDDFTDVKKYAIKVDKIETVNEEEIASKTYSSKVIKSISDFGTFKNVKESTFTKNKVTIDTNEKDVLARIVDGEVVNFEANKYDFDNSLFRVGQDVYKALGDTSNNIIVLTKVDKTDKDTLFGDKEYVLVDNNQKVYVYKIDDSKDVFAIEPIGSCDQVFNGTNNSLYTVVEDDYNVVNLITIKSSDFDSITLNEFTYDIEEDANVSKYIKCTLTQQGILENDKTIEDLYALNEEKIAEIYSGVDNKTIGIDATLRIPFRTTDNFARQLAQHCTYTELKTGPTHGILGVSKMVNTDVNSISKKVDEIYSMDLDLYAKKATGKYMMDSNSVPYPIGRNISIVFGQYALETLDSFTTISNGAAGYAGMVSCLPLDQSSTNQKIDIPAPSYELSNYQLERLNGKGFVLFKKSYSKGYVVADGTTMANANDQFRRLSVARIVNSISEIIRSASEPYIGKQNSLVNRNNLRTAIKSELEKLKGTLIESYDFTLEVSSEDKTAGIINVEYVIVPIYEIRQVYHHVKVKKQ